MILSIWTEVILFSAAWVRMTHLHFFLTSELLAILVLGESRLERYLLENPPTEANIGKACEELHEAQQQLLDVLKGEPKVPKHSSYFHKCTTYMFLSTTLVYPYKPDYIVYLHTHFFTRIPAVFRHFALTVSF